MLPSFEAGWRTILSAHGLQWWHTTDALAKARRDFRGRRDFLIDPSAPWDLSAAERAKAELHAFVGDFWEQHWPKGFQLFSCSVDLEAYRRARDEDPLLRSAEAVCVDWCVSTLKLDHDRAAVLYFDQTEDFMKEAEQVWRKDRNKPHVRWAREVKDILPVNSRKELPVQAADLQAWTVNDTNRRATEVGASFCDEWGQAH